MQQRVLATNETGEARAQARIARVQTRRSTSSGTTTPARGGAPLLRVLCRCATEQEFAQRYAADVCARGMFLRTRQALPIGARVRFELLLQSGRCALGGVGRVAWVRHARDEHDRAAGGAIAFERLRRGDRAVIERMDALRGDVPSRFDQPEPRRVEAPRGAELAKALFGDLPERADGESGAHAFLSADLSQELGVAGRGFGRARGAERPVEDLAEQLEPSAERERDDSAGDEALVPEVELVAAPAREQPSPDGAVSHSTVRPSPLSEDDRGAQPERTRVPPAPPMAPASPAGAPAPGNVYAVTAESAVSLALARSAVTAAHGEKKGRPRRARALAAAPKAAPAPTAPAPTAPAAAAPARLSTAVTAAPTGAVAAPVQLPAPAVEALAPRRRPSTAPLAIALSAIIVLATAVTVLSLTDQLPHVLRALGL